MSVVHTDGIHLFTTASTSTPCISHSLSLSRNPPPHDTVAAMTPLPSSPSAASAPAEQDHDLWGPEPSLPWTVRQQIIVLQQRGQHEDIETLLRRHSNACCIAT